MGYRRGACLFLCSLFLSLPGLADLSPSVEAVESFIEKTEAIDSVDFFLDLAKERFPNLRKNYVLAFKSKSDQGSDWLTPRVIVSSENARFFMAFAGSAQMKLGQALDLMEYRENGERFRLKRILFGDGARYEPSVINPSECKKCHRADVRPTWQPFAFWDGIYGSLPQPIAGNRFLDQRGEDNHFSDFLTNNLNRGRYAFLENLGEQFRLEQGKPVAPLPTVKLTKKLNPLNFQRLRRLITETPDYDHFRFAIQAALLDCESIESYLPAATKLLLSGTPEDWIEKTRNFYVQRKHVNLALAEPGFSYLGKLRYLLEGRSVWMRTWSMSPGGEAYGFSGPDGAPMGSYVSTLLAQTVENLTPFALFRIVERTEGNIAVAQWAEPQKFAEEKSKVCRALKEKSLASF